MPVKLEEYEGVAVLSVEGDLTGQLASSAGETAAGAIDHRQIVDVVFDLNRSNYIGSDGLETLLWIKDRCERVSGHFKLAAVNQGVKTILEITRLDRRFELAPDVPSAVKTMR